ncbi:MAG: LamG domain-containing protein [bacterium]|nr:LamG domain-containing protein [bacterium]
MKKQITMLLVVGMVVALAGTTQAGLIAHYTFDSGTAADSAPDAVDHGGALNGTASIGSGVLTLDGNSDYVQLEGGGAVQTGATTLQLTNWTLATYFKRTGAGTTVLGVSANPLITKGRNAGDSPASININYFLGVRPGGQLQGSFELANGSDIDLTGATAIVNDQWYHAAMTYDGTTMKLYLDGVLDASQTFSAAAASASTMYAAIGSGLTQSGAALGFFDGQMDDVRIYDNALELSDIEVLAGIPEPATMSLLALGGLGVLARRRRRR